MERLSQIMPAPIGRFVMTLMTGSGEGARSGRGAVMAFLIRVASAGIAFLSQVLLARWMGSFEFGIFTYVWVWINVIGTLCSLGFATSVVKFLPHYREIGNFDRFRGFLHTGRLVTTSAGILSMLVGFALLALWNGLIEQFYLVPMALALICLPAFALTDFQDGVGRAQGWIDLALVPPYIARPLLLLAFVGVSVAVGYAHDARTAVFAAIGATWITATLQYVLQKRRLAEVVPHGPSDYVPKSWFALSLPLLLLEGFGLLMLNMDVLLLNLFVSPDQIGIYFAAVKTISLISFVHFSITAVAMPRFARLHAAGEDGKILPLLKEMQVWCFAPSLAGAVLLLLLGKPLLWLFGPEFTAAYPVMVVLAAGLLVRALGGPAQSLLVVTGHQTLAAVILAATVVINGTLCFTLIPLYGVTGAAIATATAFAFEALATLALAYRHFGATRGDTKGNPSARPG